MIWFIFASKEAERCCRPVAIFVRGIDRRVERMSRKDEGLVEGRAFCDQEKEGQSDISIPTGPKNAYNTAAAIY